MKRWAIFLFIIFIFLFALLYLDKKTAFFSSILNSEVKQNETENQSISKPLEIYSIENLSKADISTGKLTIDDLLFDNEYYSSYKFLYTFHPNPVKKETKTTSGLINIPKNNIQNSAYLLLIRGYVDQESYVTGTGTKRVGEFYAQKGFVTIAPDFLGYGTSDKESENIFESRFQTYTTVLSLLKIVEKYSTDRSLIVSGQEIDLPTPKSPVFLWGHSNGGQIALTVLEITGKQYPTSLWAPVSKPFPYSILFYTDESDDRGKLIRKELSEFEKYYDVEEYSLTNYISRIKAPIILHQGSKDTAVPESWSVNLYNILRKNKINVNYITLEEADHNMNPFWSRAVSEDYQFFLEYTDIDK